MVRKLHYGSPNFDSVADSLAQVVERTDSKFTPSEADYRLGRLVDARKRDQEMEK